MKIAVCPGSFDPVTNGHIDVIRRASELFDEVIVVVMQNAGKVSPLFSIEDRVALLRRCTKDMPAVVVDSYHGLLADYARSKNAVAIVKGLRALSDFEYEFQMALTNRQLNPQLETVFLTATADRMYLSSSLVKQVAAFGGDISAFVPSCILEDIINQTNQSRKDDSLCQ